MSGPATLVANARQSAGLSRRALAQRAGVPLSTVSRIEDGDVDPGYTTLQVLLAAAGQDLRIESTPTSDTAVIARLSRAIQRDPSGEPVVDWLAVRHALQRLDRHPELVPEAISTPPARTGFAFYDTLLAGIAEKLADDHHLPRPRWAAKVPKLTQQWFAAHSTPRTRAAALATAPAQLKARNIILGESDLWHTYG